MFRWSANQSEDGMEVARPHLSSRWRATSPLSLELPAAQVTLAGREHRAFWKVCHSALALPRALVPLLRFRTCTRSQT